MATGCLQEIGQKEIERVLTEQREVRIGFAAGEERYLIALAYVWLDGCLCGVTARGRNTRLAQLNPRVAFQVDTSATTGPYTWSSVTGQGTFEVIEEREQIEKLERLIEQRFADTLDWLLDHGAKEEGAEEMVYWRIHPCALSGVELSPWRGEHEGEG
jgi:nitroimidazol reductase NimA-like FMN-containing flavoprotein (pyridoxamine 5'-phosphate oxidase superfamily)